MTSQFFYDDISSVWFCCGAIKHAPPMTFTYATIPRRENFAELQQLNSRYVSLDHLLTMSVVGRSLRLKTLLRDGAIVCKKTVGSSSGTVRLLGNFRLHSRYGVNVVI